MKKLNNCIVENCIPTPASCVEWNGGDIEYLGLCNGVPLTTLLWEIITKLEEISGEDLSEFDLDSLLDICNKTAPQEVTIISILNVLKDNQICLKDFIDTLSEQLAELLNTQQVNINLKCYAEFDNLGNSLSITRDQLDQLVIDNLCAQLLRIETLEGKAISLQSQIDNLDIPDMTEQEFATCVDPIVKPTSSQVVSVADAHCDLEDATGDSGDISSALAQTPGDLNAEFGLISGWILAPANWAENYNNLLLEVENLRQRLILVEGCCAPTCDDVEIGFSAIFNEDQTGIILKFTSGAGTSIPDGFEDVGSTGTITDIDGNVESFNIAIENNLEQEILITGLNLNGNLEIKLEVKMSNGVLVCQKCVGKTVRPSGCGYCKICNIGEEGSVLIVFESETDISGHQTIIVGDTTTTSTTTTTTSL